MSSSGRLSAEMMMMMMINNVCKGGLNLTKNCLKVHFLIFEAEICGDSRRRFYRWRIEVYRLLHKSSLVRSPHSKNFCVHGNDSKSKIFYSERQDIIQFAFKRLSGRLPWLIMP
jgi:hypothetical protein